MSIVNIDISHCLIYDVEMPLAKSYLTIPALNYVYLLRHRKGLMWWYLDIGVSVK